MTDNEHHHEHALKTKYRLHEYEIVRVLGAGGFGITYLGYDLSLDKAVAIKEYLPDDLAVRKPDLSVIAKSSQAKADYAWGLNSFMQEARTLARFQHPNLVQVHRFFEAHGTAYIVMDYVEGETLSAYLKRHGKLNEGELKAILLPILDGLEEVHKTGYLHRDIKPANIVIRHENRQPVLIDFGAARQLVGAKSKSVTAICTPGYAPIEQYSTKGNFGAWTDIYALGAVSYVALCGRSVESASDRMFDDATIPATQLAKDRASQTFLSGIDNALKNRPEDRPQSISEWRAMLMSEGATKVKQPETVIVDKPRTGKPKPHKTTALKWVAVALCAIILVGGGWYYFDQQAQHEAAVIAEREKAQAERKKAAQDKAEAERLSEEKQAEDKRIAEEKAAQAKAAKDKRIAEEKAKAEREKIAQAEREKAAEAKRVADKKTEINTRDADGRTPLHIAAQKGETEKVLALIKAGAEIDAQDNNGFTSLHLAAGFGQTETALVLIKAGAEIEAQNKAGNTPLHYAAGWGQTETALALIKAGAEIEAQANNGSTPLHLAAWNGETETALALIKAGAEIDAQSNGGNTPLHVAALFGKTETALALIKAGANVNARNNEGETPAQIAEREGHSATARAIESARKKIAEIKKQIHTRDADGNTSLFNATWDGKTEAALVLIELGADVNAQNKYGNTPLHYAAGNGYTEIALALIQAGADVNARNNKSETPAQVARERGHSDIAQAIEAAQ